MLWLICLTANRGICAMRDINLKALEYFEAVARLTSVTKAAEEIGVSPSAVSQQLRQLESQLGVKLFRREKQRLVLTLDGDRLYHTANQAFRALRNARNAIARHRDARNLAVRVSPSFGVRWLGPRLVDFIAENPDWRVRVDATPDLTEFETEAIDLDLRYGIGNWPGLHTHCVMDDFVLPLCSPAYLEKLRARSDDLAEQLTAAVLIDSAKMLYRWDVWLAGQGIELDELSYPVRFDRSSMSIELAKQGGGIALDSLTLCMSEVLSGDLVPFAPQLPVVSFSAYWLVCPPRHLSRRIVKRFSDWVEEGGRAHEAEARKWLKSQKCTIRPEDAPGLIGSVWDVEDPDQ